MVSARRGLSKCTAAAASNLRTSSQQPLLFLYPIWARGIVSSAAPAVENEVLSHRQRADIDQAYTSKCANATNNDRDSTNILHPRLSQQRTVGESTSATKTASYSPVSDFTPRRVKSESHQRELKIRRVVANVEEHYQREAHERETRNLYNEMIREERRQHEKEVLPPDRAELFETLIKRTSKRTPGTVIHVVVPSKAVPGLLFGLEDNILEIKHRTGAEIDLLEEQPGAATAGPGLRTFSLSGPSSSVAIASAIILKSTPGAISKGLPDAAVLRKLSTKKPELNSTSEAKSRVVLSRPLNGYNRRPMRADAVPRPKVYTAESIHDYVTSLTLMPMPRPMHRLLYQPGEEHQRLVEELLDEVFDNDDCLQVMSVNTLNEGLSYFMKHNQTHFVKEIYWKVEERGMRLNTETFNIMLRGAAKVQDIDTFGQLFVAMISRAIRPDSGTWLAFLAVLDDSKVTTMVLEAMKKLGLFYEPGVQAKVGDIVAPEQLQSRLNSGKTTNFQHFVRDMEQNVSENWLTVSGGNKLLKIWGIHGMISECWLLVEYMTKRGIQIDVVSGNTMLDACCASSGVRPGINLFERLVNEYHFMPDEITWRILSKHVWEAHYYATSRVLWRYGCLQGWSSFPMKTRISDSLIQRFRHLQTAWAPPKTENRKWALNAGAFVVTDQSAVIEGPAALEYVAKNPPDEPEIEETQADISESIQPRLEDAESLSETAVQRLAFNIVANDYKLATKYEPFHKSPLALIKEALAVDLEAEAREIAFEGKLEWLDAHAPEVTRQTRQKRRDYIQIRYTTHTKTEDAVASGFTSRAVQEKGTMKPRSERLAAAASAPHIPGLSAAQRSLARAERKQKEREVAATQGEWGWLARRKAKLRVQEAPK